VITESYLPARWWKFCRHTPESARTRCFVLPLASAAATLLGGVRHRSAARVRGYGINRSIDVLNQPPGLLGLLDGTARQADMGGILALAHPLHLAPRILHKAMILLVNELITRGDGAILGSGNHP